MPMYGNVNAFQSSQEWLVTVAGKQAAFHALAEYYESGSCNTSLAYGKEIARLQHAKELTQAAMTRGGREVDFSNQLAKIESVSVLQLQILQSIHYLYLRL